VTTLTWSLRTLDQNDLGLDSALKTLQSAVRASGDTNLEQALRRVELQVNPGGILTRQAAQASNATGASGARTAAGSAAATSADNNHTNSLPGDDPLLNDPNEAYRTEVIRALEDAMLEYSSSLAIGANEWLTIAAKGNDDRPRLAPADSDARTRIIRMRGSDLAQYLARQISKEDALKRIQVQVF